METYYGIPVPADFDGDGTVDCGVFRPSTGLWAVRNLTRLYFGALGDWAVPADYSGDGSSEIAIFRDTDGLWRIRGLTRIYYGTQGDVPVTR